jgi:PST family polysaccharide transporter
MPGAIDMNAADETAARKRTSYGQILRSSALIGGSSMINIALGIVRNKAMAVLIGPSGLGLFGLYSSILDLAQNVAGLGIHNSGVRQIAEAVASGEEQRIARTITVLRRVSWVFGFLGGIVLIVVSRGVAQLTFGDEEHALGVALLSFAVFLRLVSASQGVVLQGMRRIGDVARLAVLGGFLGTLVSIAAVFALREEGIVPAIIGAAAISMVTSWWYSRKVHVKAAALSFSKLTHEAAGLLKLGVAFMLGGLFVLAAGYAVRTMVARQISIEAAGLYQAAWTLGGFYVGIIVQTMGLDFYPRLTAVARDNAECNRLVNEQTLMGLLLAGPGVLATLTLAPVITHLFYSAKFSGAEVMIRWFCLGMMMRIITWPMGFIALAKARRTVFMGVDLCWSVVNVGLSWVCINAFGVDGAGIAFFGSYIVHALISYPIVRWLSGFSWSALNLRTGFVFVSLIGLAFCGFYLLSPPMATVTAMLATAFSTIYSIRSLLSIVPLGRIPGSIRRLLVFVRLMPER